MDKISSQAVASPPPATLTPMMAQFFEIKAVNPGYLLFYRMGDFYELFFEDAEIASAALGIVLTKRGKHLGEDIHMCGVPIHAANDYLNKLVKLGHRVAICEQMEDPKEAKKRGAKSVVRRDVVRLITAGTLTEDDHLDARSSNFLAALSMVRHGDTDFALAWADVSTGETFTADLTAEQLQDELARINPAEFLLTEATRLTLVDRHLFAPSWADIAHAAPPESFDSEAATATLREAFPDDTFDPSILSRASRSALGAILAYVRESQKGVGVALRAPKAETTSKYLAIDQATRSSLELHQTQRGQARGSLRHVIDLTVTAPGSRLLSARLAAPLADAGQINERLDAVQLLANDTMLTGRLRTDLKAVPDLARALTRLALDRGGPRDLVAIGKAISAAAALSAHIADLADAPAVLVRLARTLAAAPLPLASHLALALDDEVPMLSRDGGFVRKGYDQTLDDERALASQTRDVVAALQARLIEETDVRSLKIRHNGVLGYFVEVPAAHGTKLLEEPHRDIFIHRQTMANAMRFTTTELADLEGRIAKAHEAALDIERKVFASLRYDVLNHTDVLRGLADAIAEADVTTALAHLAATRRYTRPDIDNSLAFDIVGGRHPVVEDMVMAEGQSFVANDADLSGDDASGGGRLWLVTGPNMGGKSTFLRQNALIAILAQMGSFVPASSAHIGVIDRLFSRVGASDDIAHGRSTFMVEMVETAAILNRATRRSLVVLDEIGRGTATFDGLSIAWAAVEALHETTGCRALFATHFHELTSLAKTLSRVSNVTMKVREWEGEVVFLHEVGSGAADRSYGIQVARLAGLPEPVLARARQVLTVLEQRSAGTASSSQKVTVLDDLPLFAHHVAPAPVQKDPVLTALDAVRPDEMTPKQAIEALYELKKIRDDARRS
ncbi:DNA mismatch repair protein MutS [Devosia neptuniae]|jgi:DNA mismatch repair protein MutS|uniref:DNA mismatch repair protein MutS n=1 Tax=Devosia TaxID=46913 RepID=UPI0022AF30C9|nr:DNA mismatch repair protein MutS [Devosia neptuniae]MCZ4347477.1 DNA mismatch repair protein MutS [Devosia neptuniae]|tara:strand:- start:14840 stop:17554 length:2715 start_codon:yes stop_codon:yes gene_type:complete